MKAVELPREKFRLMQEGGVWVPSPLALAPDKTVMEEWQRLLTLYYIRSGARTVIPGAHTGEFAGGDLTLYARWLQLVREMTRLYGRNMFLMAAVGGAHARRQAEMAAKEGFDIVMVAPTAYTTLDDDGVMVLLGDIAGIIPVFGFELQQAIPGSRAYSLKLWLRIFEIAYGAKGASFNTYRSQVMLEAAARSDRREQLVLASGNDDRIVHDLGGVFPFRTGKDKWVKVTYHAGLLGHFATDTHAAVRWSAQARRHRDGQRWECAIPREELAHHVNMCNGALFDAVNNFENSVWGVKCRLTQLGLLPEPVCFHEKGRLGMDEEIAAAYSAHPDLNDERFLLENLIPMKKTTGVRG